MAAANALAARPAALSRALAAPRPAARAAPAPRAAARARAPAARPAFAPAPRLLLVARAAPSAPEPAPEDGEPMCEEERLSVDFDYLGNKIKATTDLLDPELKGCSLYLIGMMGSGKSTVGRMLANTLK